MKFKKLKTALAALALSLVAMGVAANPAQAIHADAGVEQCWVGTRTVKPKSLVGITVGTMSIQSRWCVQDGRVTSSDFIDYYAETSTPFNRFIHLPDTSVGAEVVDNRALAWKQFVLFFEIQTGFMSFNKPTDICSRIIGTPYGTISGDARCGAY